MSASSAFHQAVRAAAEKIEPNTTASADWSWRSTGTPGVFGLWRHGNEVGIVSLLPGAVEHESVAMEQIVHVFNEHHK